MGSPATPPRPWHLPAIDATSASSKSRRHAARAGLSGRNTPLLGVMLQFARCRAWDAISRSGGAPKPERRASRWKRPTGRRRCLAAGMDDERAKPFDREALNRVLERWVGGETSRGGQPMQPKGLWIVRPPRQPDARAPP